ncbi:dihydropteroate synthase [uncultured Rhodoblastus sp.]|uniref:dihydropteroate synthase n=1 Tax=uncultured Rhodoblastus sp. TaxID=543037 RepID=UPI0025DC3354|nr:dihydropteroate synthase [uncultured Rhodoblastus sp.]
MDRFDRTRAAADSFLAKIGQKPLVMGILNVTPDSFSDGGKFLSPESALAQARVMAQAGADILDLGAESTRPGFAPVSAEEEWARLERILAPLIGETSRPLSIDTTKSVIARRALALGAALINDVSGLRGDPAMAQTAAESGAALVIMHSRAEVDAGLDIVADMTAFFGQSLALAAQAGVERRKILLDPGIGFGKSLAQNLRALAATARLRKKFELPIVIGASRKSFLGALTGAATQDRLAATLAANLAGFTRGVAVFRVHDVAEHVAALRIWSEIDRA